MKEQLIKKILHEDNSSVLLITEVKNSTIAIGAPHHAPGGKKILPCPEHIDSDENTGFIAWKLAIQLGACSIIACNYPVDSNKNLCTDYSVQIGKWQPKYLVEIHGHGGSGKGNKPTQTEIEISSGKKNNTHSKKFSQCLQEEFNKNKSLKKFSLNGDYDSIYFQASESATIVDQRWIAFHIELPPPLRKDKKNALPKTSDHLITALAKTIKKICT